jgi:Domain of unknown function (DUF5110)
MRPLWIAVPDSSTSLVIALARYFRGRGLPLAGLPGILRPLFPCFNLFPARVRQVRRRYPAVAIGSSNGAMIHLCAALGIPWYEDEGEGFGYRRGRYRLTRFITRASDGEQTVAIEREGTCEAAAGLRLWVRAPGATSPIEVADSETIVRLQTPES